MKSVARRIYKRDLESSKLSDLIDACHIHDIVVHHLSSSQQAILGRWTSSN
eukprot:CAMPEP_0184684176 /NCGR_PEP_ID=MMETSP0312-20130426/14155_1 /TAXON_ID=31354 /ORGANISM="Compsopogon coeruleus, Strain SAG 36.94" /LENGTH=50 /DNA_ID=CAMNT_0027137095 /DNA_START=31 /DNA_END=180 /DNA_ORIENTATION=-